MLDSNAEIIAKYMPIIRFYFTIIKRNTTRSLRRYPWQWP